MKQRKTKQVIVVRDDLKMRKGKIGAQCAHAANMFLFDLISTGAKLTSVQRQWIHFDGYRKVVLAVQSEEDLDLVKKLAEERGLETFKVIDSGLTEFHGIPTVTCMSIGPDYGDEIDLVVGKESDLWKQGKLKLL